MMNDVSGHLFNVAIQPDLLRRMFERISCGIRAEDSGGRAEDGRVADVFFIG